MRQYLDTFSLLHLLICELFLARGHTESTSLNFLSIGDHGLRNMETEAVARRMALEKEAINASFVLLGGDQFYPDGVSSVEDPLWNTTFRDLFTPEAFPVPFYPIRGNHDYHSSNPDAQLEYYDTHGVDGRWIFPAAYYLLHEVLGDGTTIDFIFLDTPLLVPEEAETDGALHMPRETTRRRAQQYAWLESALARSRADWLLVFGHHPVFSTGEHGDTPGLVRHLLPLLGKHRVDMYMSGHDHSLQHLQHHPVTPTQFFVNGNGAKLGSVGHVTQAAHVKEAAVRLGFMSHHITKSKLCTRAIDAQGNVVFEHTQEAQRRLILPADTIEDDEMGRTGDSMQSKKGPTRNSNEESLEPHRGQKSSRARSHVRRRRYDNVEKTGGCTKSPRPPYPVSIFTLYGYRM
ncbi:tartrate-resistant acid phosphatase type 5 [Nannochloropsis gaditana CCMP526]|uniref:tartrate-resistant acid phosphatase type 5 n=1 Tax=Nannochloropsis gaditana (strain CCMP526) TaxID=1093141 RepID=UPI00029F4F42|nr:tartrate-resistant acid phosphatase type 5 [Nannochloropsis gaditana CCMP526]EKU20265.1 tartrate-resistant acid phosphatase type 5 [Nannochloropsis gaditana CCMP526]|eukprot:XP_005856129.1 tartrate-resistant acid phosphatase type 5 [Nannochloropsis gaditana CCMP526]